MKRNISLSPNGNNGVTRVSLPKKRSYYPNYNFIVFRINCKIGMFWVHMLVRSTRLQMQFLSSTVVLRIVNNLRDEPIRNSRQLS